ncbi:MAG: hypothetical protein MJB14_10400, partial [Spirochaetes bacterium]|nr:hypothetical protein [Spirochaetota bacterium]
MFFFSRKKSSSTKNNIQYQHALEKLLYEEEKKGEITFNKLSLLIVFIGISLIFTIIFFTRNIQNYYNIPNLIAMISYLIYVTILYFLLKSGFYHSKLKYLTISVYILIHFFVLVGYSINGGWVNGIRSSTTIFFLVYIGCAGFY